MHIALRTIAQNYYDLWCMENGAAGSKSSMHARKFQWMNDVRKSNNQNEEKRKLKRKVPHFCFSKTWWSCRSFLLDFIWLLLSWPWITLTLEVFMSFFLKYLCMLNLEFNCNFQAWWYVKHFSGGLLPFKYL